MKKALFALVVAIFSVYFLSRGGGFALPFQTGSDINTRIDNALLRAWIDTAEFGGGIVALEKGRAAFTVSVDGGKGFVSIGEPRAVVVKGEDADVLALVDIHGRGTGTFQYLVHFEYDHEEDIVHETQKVLLGDRIIVDDITAEITAPTEYEVLVSIKDRRAGEAMAAEPTEPRVLTFGHVDGELTLKAIIFGTLAEHDVVLVSPMPEAEVDNSFLVQGAARGPWYFEASFPIELQTVNGEVLAAIVAQAQTEWMTTDLVPFSTYMVAPSTAHGLHMLVLKKDNPSGLPEHDRSIKAPVIIR